MKTEIQEEVKTNAVATTVDAEVPMVISSPMTAKGRKRGLFSTASATVDSGLGTITETVQTIENTMKIVNTTLKVTLAETVAEGIKDLMKLGYTQSYAEELLISK